MVWQFTLRDLPRQLDVEALGLGGIGDVLQLVAQFGEFGGGGIEWLLSLVGGEDGLVEGLLLLVPEAVQHRGIGEAISVGGDLLEIQHDVLVVQTLFTDVLESIGNLLEQLSLVLGTGFLKTRFELSLALCLTLGTLSIIVVLDLAKFLSGNHLVAGSGFQTGLL